MSISRETVESWEFIGNTPAGGKHYYCDGLDMCANVYQGKMRVYSKRMLKEGNFAAAFEDCEIVYFDK